MGFMAGCPGLAKHGSGLGANFCDTIISISYSNYWGDERAGVMVTKAACLYRILVTFPDYNHTQVRTKVKCSIGKGKERLNVTLFVTSHSCINFVVISQNYKHKEASTYLELWLLNLFPQHSLQCSCSWHEQSALLKYSSIVYHR